MNLFRKLKDYKEIRADMFELISRGITKSVSKCKFNSSLAKYFYMLSTTIIDKDNRISGLEQQIDKLKEII